MSIEREEAARALRMAEAAADRSMSAVGYQRASGYLILWGVIWALTNIGGVLRVPNGNVVFPALILAGVIGSFILGLRGGGDAGSRRSSAVRSVVISLALSLFCFGVGVVNPVTSLINAEAIMCLAVGAAYMVLGSTVGWRLSAVGGLLMVGVIVGWIYARDQFFLWMTFTGGGGLILGGLWLRKA